MVSLHNYFSGVHDNSLDEFSAKYRRQTMPKTRASSIACERVKPSPLSPTGNAHVSFLCFVNHTHKEILDILFRKVFTRVAGLLLKWTLYVVPIRKSLQGQINYEIWVVYFYIYTLLVYFDIFLMHYLCRRLGVGSANLASSIFTRLDQFMSRELPGHFSTLLIYWRYGQYTGVHEVVRTDE